MKFMSKILINFAPEKSKKKEKFIVWSDERHMATQSTEHIFIGKSEEAEDQKKRQKGTKFMML